MRTAELTQSLSDFFSSSMAGYSLLIPQDSGWSRGSSFTGREPRFFPGRVVTPWLRVAGLLQGNVVSISEGRFEAKGGKCSWVRVCFDPGGSDGPLGDWFILCGHSVDGGWLVGRSVVRSVDNPATISDIFLLDGRRFDGYPWSSLAEVDRVSSEEGAFRVSPRYDGSVEVSLRISSG